MTVRQAEKIRELEREVRRLRRQLKRLEARPEEAKATPEADGHGVRFLATTLRAAPIGIGVVTDRIIGWTNERLQTMLGYSQQELAGQSARIFYESDEEYERIARVKHPQITVRGVGTIDTRFVAKDGAVLDVVLSSAAIDPEDWSKGLVFTVLDITAWRQAERVRDRLFDLSLDMLVVAGFDGYFKAPNPAWTRTLGWSPEELLAKPWIEFVHPEDRAPTREAKGRLEGGKTVIQFENRYLHKDGSFRRLSWNSSPLQRDELIFAVARDVTDTRRAEEALRRSEHRMRSIIDQSPFGMLLYELEQGDRLTLVGANAAADRILGVDCGACIGKTIEEAFPALAATEIPQIYRKVARTGATWMTEQMSYDEGAIQGTFEVHAFQVSPLAMVASFVDISERKRAHDAVRAARDDLALLVDTAVELVSLPAGANLHAFIASKLEQILPGSVVAVGAFERDTGFIAAKAIVGVGDKLTAVMDLIGRSPRKLRARPSAELLAHMARGRLEPFPDGVHGLSCGIVPKIAAKAIEAMFGIEEIFVMGLTRGEQTFGNVSILTRKGADPHNRKVVEAFIRQASVALERQAAEEALRAREEQLSHSQKMEAIGNLAGGIAHDFNNQLTAILACSNELKLLSEPGGDVYESAAMIETGAMRAAELTRQLLGFARKGKVIEAPFDTRGLVSEVGAMLRRTVDKRIAISEKLCSQPAVVMGDLNQLHQVILNLGLNACDAMPEGGKLVFQTEVVRLSDPGQIPEASLHPGEYVRLSVIDTGCGIPEAMQAQVFEPFFTTKPEGKGTGMGLAMAYGVVRAHGGAILLDSQVRQGTTFRILLPRSRATPPSDSSVSMPSVTGEGTILLVDDEEFIREIATKALTRLGYEVVCCPDGKSAVEYYAEHRAHIDLVILDIVMPGMNGLDCFARLRQIDASVRVLLSSGYGPDKATQELLANSGVGFVPKPYILSQLSRAVATALGAR